MGFFSSEDSVKISEKTGGAYADMSDVIDSELDDIFGSEWTSHRSHQDSDQGKDECLGNSSENGKSRDK
ncbi:MAG TPA: hypothetical protein VKC61_23275 [Pyrinomonadaceae bacterium]|nr:hypothetical protein [Pyrinomonadaceae bacterium]